MSKRSGPKLDLKLNLSPPVAQNHPREPPNWSPGRSGSSALESPISSCLSSEANGTDRRNSISSPEATSMLLVGCPRCLMYVMLSEDEPKCPKCKSTVLLDFLQEANGSRRKRS
ncbi:hypothetical protein SAY87_026717 [Trapa incisa]|uniref:GIR1-like zinc ribbon domain-containing protein n=2 Tax=Trapa TaxID=22665 RepID=A0AAN7MQU8_TRANT|nr:hypothetical protein SAY87_026717 [Trapa incisa]KAK4799476.1 hypothetical protein SAY86_024841 [Trapa natans]